MSIHIRFIQQNFLIFSKNTKIIKILLNKTAITYWLVFEFYLKQLSIV